MAQTAFFDGKEWVRDGGWWVDADVVNANGGDIETMDPAVVEANRMPYAQGLIRQTIEQRLQAQGLPTDGSGGGQFTQYRTQIGNDEFQRRLGLSHRVQDETLADELFFGHMDELPGMPGVYFNARGDGTYVFKDASGQVIPPNQALSAAAQQAVGQGYGTGAGLGNGAGPTNPNPTLPLPPQSPPRPKPKDGPIFSNPTGRDGGTANKPVYGGPPKAGMDLSALGAQQGQQLGGLPQLPQAPGAAKQPTAGGMPNFMALAGGGNFGGAGNFGSALSNPIKKVGKIGKPTEELKIG